jgi:hypothetical protein
MWGDLNAKVVDGGDCGGNFQDRLNVKSKNFKVMKKYIIRGVKYLIALCVLYVALMWLMHISQSRPTTFIVEWQILFSQWRGWTMVGVTILLAATYPKFGFVKRRVNGDITLDREQIDAAFRASGFKFVGVEEGALVYQAQGLRRLMMLFEDKIVVRGEGDTLVFDGIRRATVPVAFSAERFIESKYRVNG